MKSNSKIFYLTILMVMGAALTWAQEKTKRLTERYDTSEDVNILFDAQNTDIVFEDWNKDEVSIEAVMETEGLDEEQIEQLKNAWQLEVQGNSQNIRVRSIGEIGTGIALGEMPVSNLDQIVSSSISMLEPMMRNMMQSISGSRPAPEYYKKLDQVKFDYDSYRKEGEKYLNAYKKQMQANFGDDFKNIVSNWEKQNAQRRKEGSPVLLNGLAGMPESPFGINLNFNLNAFTQDKEGYVAAINKTLGTKASVGEVDKWLENMEIWGADFGKNLSKNMENWGQNVGQTMENWGSQVGQQMEQIAKNNNGNFSKTVTRDANGNVIGTQISYSVTGTTPVAPKGKVKRTIIVHMPKEARLDLNVRHGNIRIGEAKNARVNLSHGGFIAKTIDGDRTYLTVAYSPIDVTSWNYGTLQTNYVKSCVIDKAENINIDARASNIVINEIGGSAIIRGSFGALTIPKLSRDFKTVNISLSNSELILSLPETAYNFAYTGTRSRLDYPQKIEAKVMQGYDSQMLNGFYKEKNSDSNIMISSKFSDVVVK